MARRKKQPDATERSASVDDSLLTRSAESLGRVIGTLQRELDKAFKTTTRTRKAKATARKSAARKSGARKATAKKKKK